LGLTPGEAWLRRDEPKPPAMVERFQAALALLEGGAPFPYATGRTGFRSLDLKIDPRALIPRPETEGLVDLALRHAHGGVAADIGTGCGCIALALATEGSFDRVIAVERSTAAAALARENVAGVQPRTPVEIREGDLLQPLAGERCRVIVSNPPYLTEAEYEALAPSVRQFEPREALVSGGDGLAATRALFAGAAALLEPAGVLVLEIDERRAEAVRALAHEYRWARIGIHEDLFGRPRYALAFPREDA
jgi:release factor glutamine methyltransferase